VKTNNILISIGLSFLLLGCNSDSSKSNTAETQKVSVPTTMEMKLPKPLKSSSVTKQKQLKKVEKDSTDKNRGYLELKEKVYVAESELTMVKVNLYLADKLMPQIQEACADIPLAQTCEIAEGELSFVLDREMKNDIMEIIGETTPDDTPDETLALGKTTFTIYGDAEDYQYVLVMDMSMMMSEEEIDKTTYLQTLKWSKDETRIWSIYSTKNEDTTSSISSRYSMGKDGQTQMEIDESLNGLSQISTASTSTPVDSNDTLNLEDDTSTVEMKTDEAFHFKLTNREDYFKIVSNSRYIENEKKIYSDSSIGEISDNGGYLNFKGVFLDNEYREVNKFDANGDSVFSAYCDSSQACDLNDETTWLEQGDSTFEPTIDVQMTELSVTGGNLKEGGYLLLAPNSDISKLSVEEVFDATIGDIYVDKEVTFGTLYQKEYLSGLDSLVMIRLIFNMDEGIVDPTKEANFELVKAEDRPLLSEK